MRRPHVADAWNVSRPLAAFQRLGGLLRLRRPTLDQALPSLRWSARPKSTSSSKPRMLWPTKTSGSSCWRRLRRHDTRARSLGANVTVPLSLRKPCFSATLRSVAKSRGNRAAPFVAAAISAPRGRAPTQVQRRDPALWDAPGDGAKRRSSSPRPPSGVAPSMPTPRCVSAETATISCWCVFGLTTVLREMVVQTRGGAA
mmetsp:Transcript_2314/g.7655  ORF Transcript_2314/g.7655 Transcript_2314/m.7655 type:complete len:200 (-) Transcript_2314:1062-1661(-)